MKTLVTALMISAATFAGAAQAADESALTRAQVIAQMQEAKSAGLVSSGELDYPPAFNSTSSKDRSEVKAELAAAIEAGEIQVGEGEDAYPSMAATGSSKSRAEVKAELFDYASVHSDEHVEA